MGLVLVLLWNTIIVCNAAFPELSSREPIEFDDKSDEIILRGDAELSSDQALVRADEIRFNRETSNTIATGNVSINAQDVRFVGDAIEYNINEETLESGPFRTGNPPIHITGSNISGSINDLEISQPVLLLGEPDFLSPNFCASKVELKHAREEDIPTRIIAHNIWFRIGKVPFFYLPYLSHTVEEIPFTINSVYGNSPEYGRYLRNTILFRITPYVKLGTLIDYYTERGFLMGPALQYSISEDCKRTKGELQTGFIHDTGSRKQLGVDSLGRKTPRGRNFIEWHHQQEFTENFQITGQLRRWSDSNSLRDFRPKLFNNDNDPDNFAEAVYTGKNYYLTGFTRYSPNNFQNVQQRIPELNFNLLPTRIACTPIYQTINARVAHLHENNPFKKHAHRHDRHFHKHHRQTSDRMDIFYGLHAPFNIGDILTFTPLIGGQVDQYFKRSTHSGQFTRLRGQAGFDLQLNSYAQWDCKNKIWGVDGLRHIARPIVQYRFIPEHNIGKGPIPQIDRHVFTTNIHPIDLNYLRDIDDARPRNTVRFGLENIFQTRNPLYGSRELAYLNIYQDYLIKENRKQDQKKNLQHAHWSDLYTELGISPAYWITFKLYNRMDVNRGKLSELNTSLTLTDARFWSLTYTTDFLHEGFKHAKNRHQHFIKPMWRITPRTFIAAEARYDCKLHLITKETFAINTQFSNAWGAELQVIHRRRAVRESKWEVSLLINLLPFDTTLLPISLL